MAEDDEEKQRRAEQEEGGEEGEGTVLNCGVLSVVMYCVAWALYAPCVERGVGGRVGSWWWCGLAAFVLVLMTSVFAMSVPMLKAVAVRLHMRRLRLDGGDESVCCHICGMGAC